MRPVRCGGRSRAGIARRLYWRWQGCCRLAFGAGSHDRRSRRARTVTDRQGRRPGGAERVCSGRVECSVAARARAERLRGPLPLVGSRGAGGRARRVHNCLQGADLRHCRPCVQAVAAGNVIERVAPTGPHFLPSPSRAARRAPLSTLWATVRAEAADDSCALPGPAATPARRGPRKGYQRADDMITAALLLPAPPCISSTASLRRYVASPRRLIRAEVAAPSRPARPARCLAA